MRGGAGGGRAGPALPVRAAGTRAREAAAAHARPPPRPATDRALSSGARDAQAVPEHAAVRARSARLPWRRAPSAVRSQLAGHAQLARRRARVGRHLARRGCDSAARDELGLRSPPANANGEVGRAHAATRAIGEIALHAAVLQRVERDSGEPTAFAQQVPGGRQPPVERAELVVHRDADGLEHALGGVAATELLGGRHGRLDRVHELEGGLYRSRLPPPRDGTRDLPGKALLAVTPEQL